MVRAIDRPCDVATLTVGAPYENMLTYSEGFSVATWDKNGGTCMVSTNAFVALDGNTTADTVTASGAAGLIRQNVAGLVATGQYTFYVWLKVPSGTMTVSLGILDNGRTTWLVGPAAVTLTVGRVPPAGQRSEEGLRQDVGLPGFAGCGRSCVLRAAGGGEGQRRDAVPCGWARIESRGPHATASDRWR